MTPLELVDALKLVAYKNAAKAVLTSLEKPPGRSPSLKLVRLGEWFRHLTPEDRLAVEQVTDMTAMQAVYNVLLAFDGLLAVEASGPKGEIEIIYKKAGMSVRLNQPDVEALSEIFKRNS